MSGGVIGIFGGTFDPIHIGHLRPAVEVRERLNLSELRFLPCGIPPHRHVPHADAATRLAMVRAAVTGLPDCVVDDREIHRPGPAYTVISLEELRAESPDSVLCLLLGMDAFLGLTTWHRWEQLFELAHIIVAHRPGWNWTPDNDARLAEQVVPRITDTPESLRRGAGAVYFQEVTQLEISATALRRMAARGESLRYLVPDEVCEMIQKTGCYAPNQTER